MADSKRTVLLTRPKGASEEFTSMLGKHGIEVLHFPMIEILPPKQWDEVDAALEAIAMYSEIVFTSANAVHFFFHRMKEQDIFSTSLPPCHAVGQKTAAALESHGISAHGIPDTASAADLAAALGDVSNQFFLQPGSDLLRAEFCDTVEAKGGRVKQVTVYRTVQPSQKEMLQLDQMLIEGSIDCIAFFSPSAVKNFIGMIPLFTQATILIATIGQTTAAAVLNSGLRVDIIAPEQTAESLASAIAERIVSLQRIELDPDQFMDFG